MTDTPEPAADAVDGAPDDGYRGPAQLIDGGRSVDVQVVLRGQVDTFGGHYHWYGRLAADPAVDALAAEGGTVVLRTPHGEVPTQLRDPDTWGRLRVEGHGVAPFPVLADIPPGH